MNSVIELHILVNADKKNNCQINLMILAYAKVTDVLDKPHHNFPHNNVSISMILYIKSWKMQF